MRKFDRNDCIEKIIDTIESDLENTLSITDIARVTGFSKRHIQNIFKKNVGINIYEYIRRRKLTRAALQLMYTNKTVSDISFDSGYKSLHSFYKAFKKMFTLTPLEYRNQKDTNHSLLQGNFNQRKIKLEPLGIFEKEFRLKGKYYYYEYNVLKETHTNKIFKRYYDILKEIDEGKQEIYSVNFELSKDKANSIIRFKMYKGVHDDRGELFITRKKYLCYKYIGSWEEYTNAVRQLYIHGDFSRGNGPDVEYFTLRPDMIHGKIISVILYIPKGG